MLDKQLMEKASSNDLQDTRLEQLSEFVRKSDAVLCHTLDRLARNLDDLRKLVSGFTERGIRVRFKK